MKYKLNLEAAKIYGSLISFVPEYSRDNFVNTFEKFLDAYDTDNAEKINTDVEVPDDEDYFEKWTRLIKDAIEHANFNGDVEKFAKANGLKFDKQRENSRLSELYKRFVDKDNVNFFSARRRDDGSIEIQFEEIREV